MLEGGKVTYKQLIQLVFTSRIIIAINYLPAITAPPDNQGTWISTLLAFPI